MKIIKEIGRNPQIDWIIILSLSVIVIIILAIGGINLYNAVTSGNIQGTPAVSPDLQRFDDRSVSSVTELFSQREDISKKAKAGYSGVGDPSI